jgi:CRP-like cAMP-binding protein
VTSIDIFRKEGDVRRFAAGAVVFRQEDAPDVMYGIVDGELEIRVGDHVIDRVGPGGIVGEMALIDHQPRSATVVAIADTGLVAIDQKRFLFLVQQTPFFAINVMKVLAERMRKLIAASESSAR